MQFLMDLIRNPVFLAAAGAWFLAQGSKILLDVIQGRFTPDRLGGGGGMPSAHSATVTGLATATAFHSGGGSSEFVIALFLAIIVIYDAMGVRYTTGRQSKILNRILRAEQQEATAGGTEKTKRTEMAETSGRADMPKPAEKPLEEKMGHTLPEIAAGCLIGITVGTAVSLLLR